MKTLRLLALAVLVSWLGGCAEEKKTDKTEPDKKTPPAQTEPKTVHDHSGWWCDEHGIPEKDCARCNAKLAAKFKKKGDWCAEHERPKSQCFKCDPKLQDKFAAQYRAKLGKEPPEITDP